MNNIVRILKKTGLFLLGIFLIIWGYKVNATNIEEKAKAEEDKKEKEANQTPVPTPSPENSSETNPEEEQETKKESTVLATKKEQKKEQSVKPKTAVPVKKTDTVALIKNKTEETPVKIEEPKKTVIETATPEESSGTE